MATKWVSTRGQARIQPGDIEGFRRDGLAFSTSGSLRGGPCLFSAVIGFDTDQLPHELKAELVADEPDYAVWSYRTPIAWHGKRGWIVPNVSYSVTTSKHQGLVRGGVRE